MFIDLILNMTIIISYVFLLGLFSRFIHKEKDYSVIFVRRRTQMSAGVLFGILGIILMYFSIQVNEQVIVDLRHIATVISAIYFGFPAAIVSSIIIGFSRLVMFGEVNAVSLTAMMGMLAIGVGCALFSKLKLTDFAKYLGMTVISLVVIYFILYINLTIFTDAQERLYTIYWVHLLVSIIGGLLAFYVTKYIFESNVLFDKLRVSNHDLEESNTQLKENQEKYRSLSEHYESVVETVKEVIFTTDAMGKWTFLNQAWTEITGYSIKESLKTEIIKYVHPEDLEKNQQLLTPLINGEKDYCRHEIRFITKDGSYKWMEVFARPSFNKEGKIVGASGTLNDTTQRKEMEDKLMESEQQYKSLFEYNQSATFTLDTQGHFKNVNHSVHTLTGYKKEELIGSAFTPFIHKEYLTTTLNYFSKIIESGESVNFETVLVHKNGNDVFLQVNTAPIIIRGEIVGAIGVAHDFTKQKQADQLLKQSEKRYKSLIHLSPEVIFVHSRDKIEFINDRALSFIGAKSKDEIIGKSVFDFIHPEDKKIAGYNMILGFSNSKEMPEFNDLRFIRLDGTEVIANVGAKLIEYKGEPAMLGVVHDVTKQKAVEKKLKEANEFLVTLSHLDGLTGIGNRRFYEETFEKEWRAAIRHNQPISVLMLDIDCFKSYNDTYGHQQGDDCLKQVANTIKSSISRPKDFAARYGGEEFSVILPDTDEEGASCVAELVRSNIEKLQIPHLNSLVSSIVTVSVGVATLIPLRNSDYKDLIKSADEALYLAKEKGRNQVVSTSNIRQSTQ